MGILTCPVCRARLERKDKSFVCSRGHSFDLSASGYLHLLPSSQMRSKVPGDNRQMVQARRNFLQKGYYQPISDALNRQLLEQEQRDHHFLPGHEPHRHSGQHIRDGVIGARFDLQ